MAPISAGPVHPPRIFSPLLCDSHQRLLPATSAMLAWRAGNQRVQGSNADRKWESHGSQYVPLNPDTQAVNTGHQRFTMFTCCLGDSDWVGNTLTFNRAAAKTPGMIVYVTSAHQIQQALSFAFKHNIRVSTVSSGMMIVGNKSVMVAACTNTELNGDEDCSWW